MKKSLHARALQLCGAAAIALAMTGCASSISDSISDSVSSPFKWSSRSSDSSGDKDSYLREIRDYTEAYLRSNSDLEGYRRGITSLAARHGISNWEADEATFTGIGEGLREAGLKPAQLEAYLGELSGGNAERSAAIARGYHQHRKEG